MSLWTAQFLSASVTHTNAEKMVNLPDVADGVRPFVTCELKEGLGNHFFILFATFAYAMDHGLQVKLPTSCLDRKPVYYKTIFCSLQKYVRPLTNARASQRQIFKEQSDYVFNELPPPKSKQQIILRGWFQHPNYFDKHWSAIKYLFDMGTFQTESYQAISLHFRLGDYDNLRHIYPYMTVEYYVSAVKHIVQSTGKDDWQLHYALQEKTTEKIQSILERLSTEFPRMELVRIPHTKADWEQLLHMSCCRHNVIANSTFSFMAAKFNRHNDAIVVYPNKWHTGKTFVAPKEWKQCEV